MSADLPEKCWEYLIDYHFEGRAGWEWNPALEPRQEREDVSERLERFGLVGWELVSVIPNYIWQVSDEVKSPGAVYFFKRAVR